LGPQGPGGSPYQKMPIIKSSCILISGGVSFITKSRIPKFFVCLSVRLYVCPSVCPCVCATPQKIIITFEPAHRMGRNFLGHPNSSQVIFGRVTRTPGPTGSGSDPEKGGFRQIYLLPGFSSCGVVSYLFGIGMTRATKRWERNFEFWPSAGENWAGRCGWAGLRKKFWNFHFFHKRDPC